MKEEEEDDKRGRSRRRKKKEKKKKKKGKEKKKLVIHCAFELCCSDNFKEVRPQDAASLAHGCGVLDPLPGMEDMGCSQRVH
eukprot:1150214-Pelagomonas_calceolata.AAC.2